jgi:transposase-like protein
MEDYAMATTNRRTNRLPAEALVAGDRDLMRALMKDAMKEVLEAEMTELLSAAPDHRTETRSGHHAGYYRDHLPSSSKMPLPHQGSELGRSAARILHSR